MHRLAGGRAWIGLGAKTIQVITTYNFLFSIISFSNPIIIVIFYI
jgi:hypothetical protein